MTELVENDNELFRPFHNRNFDWFYVILEKAPFLFFLNAINLFIS